MRNKEKGTKKGERSEEEGRIRKNAGGVFYLLREQLFNDVVQLT